MTAATEAGGTLWPEDEKRRCEQCGKLRRSVRRRLNVQGAPLWCRTCFVEEARST